MKADYVTEEDRELLGVQPEIKRLDGAGGHLIKFRREKAVDVTYGLRAVAADDRLIVEASVNNKSTRFDYDDFAGRLKSYYWRACHEKPFTEAEFSRFAYSDFLRIDPRMGRSVSLDIRPDKADIIRLLFEINPAHAEAILERQDVLEDLIENYCLAPLKRIYAESCWA
jgi:hypothetical protein